LSTAAYVEQQTLMSLLYNTHLFIVPNHSVKLS